MNIILIVLGVKEDDKVTAMELEEIASIASDSVTSAAIIAGGIWAYFKFIRYRTLKPRLNFECKQSKHRLSDNYNLWIFRVLVINIGSAKVELPSGDKHLRVSLAEDYTQEAALQFINFAAPTLKATIFREHTWIEPGETISDTFSLVVTSNIKTAVCKVELIIYYGARTVWSNSWIVPLTDS